MNSGTNLSIKYQLKSFSKKVVNMDIEIPKRSKNNDSITVDKGKNKVNIFLKQKRNSQFLTFGHNLLSLVNVSIYDILLRKDYIFHNFYGNKLTIKLADLRPWTINESVSYTHLTLPTS